VAHVYYKANSDVCHTAAILEVAHGNLQQPPPQPRHCINIAIHNHNYRALHYAIRLLTPQPMMSLHL